MLINGYAPEGMEEAKIELQRPFVNIATDYVSIRLGKVGGYRYMHSIRLMLLACSMLAVLKVIPSGLVQAIVKTSWAPSARCINL